MNIPLFFKICVALSLAILCLAVYFLSSSPVPEPARTSESAPIAAAREPIASSSEPAPPVAASEARELPGLTPGARSSDSHKAGTAAPIEHTGLAARRVSAAAAAASPAATPDNAPAAADIDTNALPLPMPAAIVSGEVPATLPLALVPADPTKQLNELQQMGMDSLRKGFVDAVGGPDQDPNNPEYLRRWLDATKRSDDLYKTMFGWEAYAEQQRRAVREAGGVKAYFEQQVAAQQLKK